jgi:hypothetical protein
MYRTKPPEEKLIEVAHQIHTNGIEELSYPTFKKMLGLEYLSKEDWINVRSKIIIKLNYKIFPQENLNGLYLLVVRGRGIEVRRDEEGDTYMLWKHIQANNRRLKIERSRLMIRAEKASSPEMAKRINAVKLWSEEANQAMAARALASGIINEDRFKKLMKGISR